MTLERNPKFLAKKYGTLHTAPEVQNVLRARAARQEQSIPRDPASHIQAYLDRFREIIELKDLEKRERGITAIKRLVARTAIIQPQDIPESVFVLEQRIARELGHGTLELTDEFREKKTEEILSNQHESLNKWIDYLVHPDASYPDWVKYWVFRSMLDMGKFQKEQDEQGIERAVFKRRTKDTASPFPPLNQRALSMTVSGIMNKLREEQKPKEERQPVANLSKRLKQAEYEQLLSSENFSKIYTQLLIEIPAYSIEGLEETRGKWVKYPHRSDPRALVDSLDGYPLEWCTAGLETAKNQLNGGDFYVYYSLDEENEPRIPRVAIRMEADRIAEVRGIAPDQHLDPYIGDVVQKKMQEFPDSEVYQKKAQDMKMLTAIEKKEKLGMELTRDELIFLYELNSKIEGFGYERDPRIEECRASRDVRRDIPVVFGCESDEIAFSRMEVSGSTVAYVGPPFKGMFRQLRYIEHLYIVDFPNGRVEIQTMESGGHTGNELLNAIEDKGYDVVDIAETMVETAHDMDRKIPYRRNDLVRLSVWELFGDEANHTVEEVVARGIFLGLERCSWEVGPYLRLGYNNQALYDDIVIAMTPIHEPQEYGEHKDMVFLVGRDDHYLEQQDSETYLGCRSVKSHCTSMTEFIFSCPKG